jgi:hypothetical protein
MAEVEAIVNPAPKACDDFALDNYWRLRNPF